MYRTKIHGPEMHETISGLCLGTSSNTNSGYNSEIPYSDKVEMVNGVPTLVDPTTGKFTTLSSFSSLKGKYIKLDGAVYLVPSNATITWTLRNGLYEAHVVTAQKVMSVEFTIYSGVGEKNAIRSCKITYAANDGDDLVLGSVCSACLEVNIVSRGGNLSIGAGTEVIVYKVAEDGTETQIGVFNCEKPTKLTANTYKVLAYDNVRKLDVDMTEWLRSLTEWPYAVTDFYTMICEQCGLTGRWTSWSGIADYMVHQFDVEKTVNGRQLVSWCAEVMGDYCIANADGSLQCQWYRRGYIELFPCDAPDEDDATTYYQDSLSYDDFLVEDVGEVLCRADRDGELWGAVVDADITDNPYIITGNPILMNHPTYGSTSNMNNSVYTALKKIGGRFNYIRYQPFRVTIPEFLPAKVGYFVWLRTDKGIIYAPITTLVWNGQRMMLECAAKQYRETDKPENMSNGDILDYSDGAVSRTPQDVLFDRVKGSTPGLNLTDGKISVDQDFQHDGLTVSVSGHYFNDQTSSDEELFETWLSNQLSGMANQSVRDVAFRCNASSGDPQKQNTNVFYGRLCRHNANYAVLYGFDYGGKMLYKRLNGGTWQASVTQTIGGG